MANRTIESKSPHAFDASAEPNYIRAFTESILGTARNMPYGFEYAHNLMPIVFMDESSPYSSESVQGPPYTTPTAEDEARWDQDYNNWLAFSGTRLEVALARTKICFFHVRTLTADGWREWPVIPETGNRLNQWHQIANVRNIVRPDALQVYQDHYIATMQELTRLVPTDAPQITSVLVMIDSSGSLGRAELEPTITEFLGWLPREVGRMQIDVVDSLEWSTERWLGRLMLELGARIT